MSQDTKCAEPFKTLLLKVLSWCTLSFTKKLVQKTLWWVERVQEQR